MAPPGLCSAHPRDLPASLPHPRNWHHRFWHPKSYRRSQTSLPIVQMRTPRPRKHRVVSEVTKMSECWKYTSHAGGLPDTPPRPRPTPPPPGLPTQHPLKSSSVSQTAWGWGWYWRFPVWALREGAERGKEEGAASSHKRLQRARASAKRASTAPRSPAHPAGPGLPAPPPPCGQGHSSSASLPGALGSPGEGRSFPCSPGSCHPRREPGNASASCPAATGRRRRRPTLIRLSARRGSGLSCGFQGLGAGKKRGSRMGKLRLKVGST